ncbi:hypothetical protein B0H13DRAFT_326297 [Mycena leptocephala]|nr:hypothetical protein B0H13DRAFT_326297 [Mycena leptocephala]
MRISFLGTPPSHFSFRVLRDACNWGLGLCGGASWMVWTLPPERNWVGLGRRFYFILIHSPPTFSFLAFAFSRARASGARAFVEVLPAWYGRCGPRGFGDWAGFSFYYFGTRGRRLCSFFKRVRVGLGACRSHVFGCFPVGVRRGLPLVAFAIHFGRRGSSSMRLGRFFLFFWEMAASCSARRRKVIACSSSAAPRSLFPLLSSPSVSLLTLPHSYRFADVPYPHRTTQHPPHASSRAPYNAALGEANAAHQLAILAGAFLSLVFFPFFAFLGTPFFPVIISSVSVDGRFGEEIVL